MRDIPSDKVLDVPETLAEAWGRLALGDSSARRELVMAYLPLVKSIAWDVYAKANLGYVEMRDLVQLGVVGLLECINRFDPNIGVSFPGFAVKRIRGSILNGLEQQSEFHAQTAFRRRVRRERLESLKSTGCETGGAISDVFAQMMELALGLAVGYLLENSSMYVDESRRAEQSYTNTGEVAVISGSLKLAISLLPEVDRQVIELHYLGAMQFSDIAEIMGVSKGRISQIHARALKALRDLNKSKAKVSFEA